MYIVTLQRSSRYDGMDSDEVQYLQQSLSRMERVNTRQNYSKANSLGYHH